MRPSRLVYLAAALPFLAFALLGAEYGAFGLYLAPAVLCAVQFFFPTTLGWTLITVLYGSAVLLYTWLALADLWRLMRGEAVSLFLDSDDSLAFLFLLALLYLFLVALLFVSPWKKLAGPGDALTNRASPK
jgi:hypothetical protein